MALKKEAQSRKDFLKTAAVLAGGVGLLAFPDGASRVVTDVSPGVQRLTDS